MSVRVLLTGATGNVGREVLASLSQHDCTIRLGSRRVSDISASADGVETVYLDINKPESYAAAVEDCDALFLLRPPAVAKTKTTLNVLIDRAREAGVQRIVFLSVAGAGDNKLVPHHAVEQKLKEGPQDWTILRPGFFAQNLATAYRDDIVQDNRIYVPAGDGLVAWIDLRDVGIVGADVLTDLDHHAGRTYTLTGPAAFTFDQVATFMSLAVGRPIEYEAASILGYFRHLQKSGLNLGQTFIQTVLHVGLRYGQAETVDPAVEQLLGHRPHTVEEYIQDHADLLMRNEP